MLTKRKMLWSTMVVLTLAVGGLVYAGAQANAKTQSQEAGIICPITGEELSCSACCPLD